MCVCCWLWWCGRPLSPALCVCVCHIFKCAAHDGVVHRPQTTTRRRFRRRRENEDADSGCYLIRRKFGLEMWRWCAARVRFWVSLLFSLSLSLAFSDAPSNGATRATSSSSSTTTLLRGRVGGLHNVTFNQCWHGARGTGLNG